MLPLDLIIPESSICLRDFSGIYEAQESCFPNTGKYLTVWNQKKLKSPSEFDGVRGVRNSALPSSIILIIL